MYTDRIEINPRVCGGKPVIRGTRIPISVLVDQLAEGESWDSMIRGYPELTDADNHLVIVGTRRERWVSTIP